MHEWAGVLGYTWMTADHYDLAQMHQRHPL
jgi:hypothetical protein